MTAQALTLAGVRKTYKGHLSLTSREVIRGLDLQVEPGEVFGLLGQNGAGKTTTLKMILSLIFPGLGHAYAGAWTRALAFAALPILLIALAGGIFLRVDRFDLLGFIVQPQVLTGIFIVNILILVYRIVAAIDAWNVARFLNEVDASGGGRLGRSKLPLSPLSVAGLLAVLIVLGGAHIAVARYDLLAYSFVDCVFDDSTDAQCEAAAETPEPLESLSPGATGSPAAS